MNVINLVSIATLEHRLLDTLKFKASMAAGVLDNGEENIFLGEDRFKEFMNSVENLTQRIDAEAEVDAISPVEDTEELIGAGKVDEQPIPEFEDSTELLEEESASPIEASPQKEAPKRPATSDSSKERKPETSASPQRQTAGGGSAGKTPGNGTSTGELAPPSSPQELVSMGVNFLSGLSQTLASPEKTAELVNSLVQKDEATGQTFLKIPVQNQEVVSNALQVLGALFGGLGK